LGTIIGAALGALLSGQVVPRLAQDASGTQITPPFIVQAEGTALAQYVLILLVVLAVTLLFSLVLVGRLSLTRTLRLGED
jgi:CheY-specific phosphatase CheX